MLDPRTDKLVMEIARKHNLSPYQVEEIKNSMFLFINKTISNIDFSNVKSREDFDKIKHSFNIPRIGKLYPSYAKLIKLIKYGKNIK
jgi:hypothetical protein